MGTKGVNSQKIGKKNLEIVVKYLATEKITKIPKNQFNEVSRKKVVVDLLGLKKSSLENKRIIKAFDEFDSKISKNSNKIQKNKIKDKNEFKNLKVKITILESKIALLEADNRDLKQKKINIEWLKNTGWLIRP
jgi:predicted  nucleic acid-binding Zn-ribbon protein